MAVVESAPTSKPQFSVGGAISFGWRKTWKNFWRLLLVVIVIEVINAVLSLISGLGTTSSIDLSNPDTITADQLWESGNLTLSIIGGVIQFLASVFLGLGVVRIALSVTRGEKVQLGKVFSFGGFGRYLISSIIVGIVVTIGLLVGIVPGVVIAASTDSIVWAAVGVAVGLIIAIALSLGFGFFGYLIIDRDARGLSSLGGSFKLVTPHFFSLLGLYILIGIISVGLLIAAFVLGILMLFVGLFITLPLAGVVIFGLSALSVAYAYKTVAGESVAS